MNPPSSEPRCRHCAEVLRHTFVDLGATPLCQTQIVADQLGAVERMYPLHAMVCATCFMVQLRDTVPPEIMFTEYAYFSSYVDALVEQARVYCAAVTKRLGLSAESRVMEVASNDGYLLQHFVARGMRCLGIEPAANVAQAARARGVPTECVFLGQTSAAQVRAQHGPADLLIGNNVLAHVPDLNDFVAGLRMLLAPHGTLTMEFPHLMQLVRDTLFDTIYHEHVSYLSLGGVCRLFAARGLQVWDVEEVASHGGSYRVYVAHEAAGRVPTAQVAEALARERAAGLEELATYTRFADRVAHAKRELLSFLIEVKRRGERVAAYGAPGKACTLLNYCGIRTDFLDFTVDRNPYKQGAYLPGSRVPVLPPTALAEHRPDWVLILPWNLKDEIVAQMSEVRQWGGRFVVPLPTVQVIE